MSPKVENIPGVSYSHEAEVRYCNSFYGWTQAEPVGHKITIGLANTSEARANAAKLLRQIADEIEPKKKARKRSKPSRRHAKKRGKKR